MIGLAFSSNGFTRHTLLEAIEKLAEIGYEALEILADKPHVFASELMPQDVNTILSALSQYRLKVSNINANCTTGYYTNPPPEPFFEPALSNPDGTLRQWRINYTKKCLDFAREVGAENISITSGRPSPGCPPEEGLKFLRDALLEILDHAHKVGVRVGIEYEPGLLIENADELGTLFQDIDSPYLGANLDIGHATVIGENVPDVIRRLMPRIFNLHVEDIKKRKHYHLIPGTGDIRFQEIIKTLRECNYTHFLTVELYTYINAPVDAARASYAYLAPLLRTN
jgi:sugar phosphate isomerase/epimerase